MTDLFETILIALACPLILPFVVDKEDKAYYEWTYKEDKCKAESEDKG